MQVINQPSNRQADDIKASRIGRDDSILVFFRCGMKLQLSASQIAILQAIDENRGVRSRDLYSVVALKCGPATPSQRASLSRALRRLQEQSLIYRTPAGSLACGGMGSSVVAYLRGKELLSRESRAELEKRLTGRHVKVTPLTFQRSREGAA